MLQPENKRNLAPPKHSMLKRASQSIVFFEEHSVEKRTYCSRELISAGFSRNTVKHQISTAKEQF
jgi:hypothetical protein